MHRPIRWALMFCRTTAALVLVSSLFSSAAAGAEDRSQPSDQSLVPLAPGQDHANTTVNWKGALTASLKMLSLQHGARIALQDWTRDELGGPFFRDWMRSLRVPRTWGDGDAWTANYLGHSIEGAAAGFIWIDNERARQPTLGFSKAYWASRARAAAWSGVYSLEFEFGPLSEASIGNVGLRPENTGWVDHVMTPAGGLGLMIAEDALDRYVITKVDARTTNGFVRAVVRVALNPSRALSALSEGRVPWDRASRPLEH
jgi:hypothetical protein